jgi:hypothetical protein
MPHPAALNDSQMARFVTSGVHSLDTGLGDAALQGICDRTREVFETEGNPGNAILQRVPELHEIFRQPNVVGAITSLVGPNFRLCCHRHPHLTKAGSADQGWHQDGTPRKFTGWSRPWRRHHHTRQLLAIFFPHDTPLAMGPTGVVEGSQYYNRRHEGLTDIETPLASRAGTLHLADFDVWHRARANQSDRDRMMIKFVLRRTEEPLAPSWCHEEGFTPDFDAIAQANVAADARTMAKLPRTWRAVWRWYCAGRTTPAPATGDGSMKAIIDRVMGEDEAASIEACYELATHGERAVGAMVEALCSANEQHRETAAVALGALGAAAVPALVRLCAHSDPWVRASSVDTLGDIGLDAVAALHTLCDALRDADPWVRHNAAAAIGQIGTTSHSSEARKALLDATNDHEPWVRYNALSALLNLGLGDQQTRKTLEQMSGDHANQVSWLVRDTVEQRDLAAR